MDGLESNALLFEYLAEKDLVGMEFDIAIAIDTSNFIVARVVQLRQLAGIRSPGGPIDFCRCLASQMLMRTFMIVDVSETIKALLLAGVIGSGRQGGLLFEGPMIAFMSPVLLRMTGLDQKGLNA